MTFRTDRAGRSQSAGANHTAGLVAPWRDETREKGRVQVAGLEGGQRHGGEPARGASQTRLPATWAPFPTAGCNPAGIAVWGGRRAVRFRGSPTFFIADRILTGAFGGQSARPSRPTNSQDSAGPPVERAPSPAAATQVRARTEVVVDRRGSPLRCGGFSHASGGALPAESSAGASSPSSLPRRSFFFPAGDSDSSEMHGSRRGVTGRSLVGCAA